MQSSAAVAARALIMLACVVGIPAVALSGASWSDMLKKLQDFRWPMILDLASASSTTSGSASGDEAPRFTPSTATGMPAAGAARAARSAPGALGPMPVSAVALPGQTTSSAQSAVIPAGYQESMESAPIQPPAAADGDENARAGSISTADPFHCIQDRLRQLGATYYLLESWGNQQQMYRFYCKMAIGGSPPIRAASRPPIPTPFRRCARCCNRWKRSTWEVGTEWN